VKHLESAEGAGTLNTHSPTFLLNCLLQPLSLEELLKRRKQLDEEAARVGGALLPGTTCYQV
jgi:hypothetical protein